MMTDGMKRSASTKGSVKEMDKTTNIKCSACGDVVGMIAAGYKITLSKEEGIRKQASLCKCGKRTIFSVVKA